MAPTLIDSSGPGQVLRSHADVERQRVRMLARARMFGDAQPVVQERYVLRERIGAGGLGVVYRAHDLRLDRDVALKFVRRRSGDETEADAIAREAKVLAKLSHPNIVPIFDLAPIGHELVMAMELVEGETLEQRMVGPMPWRAVLPIFQQLGDALAAAHRMGVVHGDIKPGNVMVDRDGRVRVLDFGLARQITGEALPGDEMLATMRSSRPSGTAGFLAPERYDGVLDERTDQFAFCVMFYVALLGRVPLPLAWSRPSATDLAALDFRHARGIEVPRWLQSVIRRGLAERPEARFPSMSALVAALRAPQRAPAIMAAGTTLALGLATWSFLSREPPCASHDDAFAGVWDEGHRAALLQRAPQEFGAAIVAAADDTIARWHDADRDSCSARIEQRTPTLSYELQQSCLQRAAAALDYALERARQPEFTAWRQLAPALTALDPGAACSDAAELLEQVAGTDDPQLADAIHRGLDRGYLAYALGDDDAYVAQTRATLEQHGDRARAPRATLLAEARLGAALARRRQFDEAARVLESAMIVSRGWPRWPEVEGDLLTALSTVALRRGQTELARLYAREAIAAVEALPRQRQRESIAWERVAAAEAELGNHDAALAAVERADAAQQEADRDLAGLATSGGSSSRAALRGALLARAGRVDEAEAVLRAGVAQAHADGASATVLAPLHGNLGHLLWKRQRAAEAIDELQAAREHFLTAGDVDEAANVAAVLGNALSSLGDREGALEVFDEAIGQARDAVALAQLRFNRAIVLQALGRYEEALADYSAVVRRPGEDAKARRRAWSAGLGRGTALVALGRRPSALGVLAPLLDVEPDRASDHDRAELRIALGMIEWDLEPSERDRAHDLVLEGLEIAKSVRNGATLVEQATRWLSDHPAPQ